MGTVLDTHGWLRVTSQRTKSSNGLVEAASGRSSRWSGMERCIVSYELVFGVLTSQVVAYKQVQLDEADAALDEYDHMRLLRVAPHIAALHDGLEYNRKTSTLSFFMDY
jgi:hypothetical protein